MLSAVLSKWLPLLIALGVDCVFFINLCSWIFRCGCVSLWAGADMACNIHVAYAHMAHGRHCPFCAHGSAGQAVVMIAIIVPQVFVSLGAPWKWGVRAAAALALFPAVEGAAALIMGWADGYWNR